MQIVIDIDEKDYQSLKEGHIPFNVLNDIMNIDSVGLLLPKGHGDLIDIDDIRVIELDDGLHFIQHKKGDDIDVYIDAPTIIEADKEGE